MGPPQRQNVAQISQEFGIPVATLYNWWHNWGFLKKSNQPGSLP
jgi:transposase-like protein